MTTHELGALIQAYARARWGRCPDPEAALHISSQLDSELRLRIEVLGSDGERLLSVDAKDVLTELEALEREALREDALARPRIAGVRERELVDRSGQRGAHSGQRPSPHKGRRIQRGQR